MICVLSGGVGAARLLSALSGVVDPRELTAVVNVGDDLVLHGLTICPDLDTITYTLAGLNNEELGWGLAGETWRVMDELAALGGEAWFRLGDRDLATHLYRSERLRQGATKSEVARELCERHGVAVRLIPASDDPVATVFETERGRLSFQEYFVRERHAVVAHALDFVGADAARVHPDALAAIASAERVVIAPSNPLISVGPMLALAGLREALRERDDVVAVAPIVAGAALKGPADRLLGEFGYEVSVLGVADYYGDLVRTWVIDVADAEHEPALRARGHEVIVTATVMSDPANARALAERLR